MVITCIAAVVLGVLIGVMSGLLGIGGGTVMVPVFRLVFGLSAFSATATSLFTIVPTSISGAVGHLRNKTGVPALGLAMGLGGALTSPVGVLLANRSPSWLVMVCTAAVIGYSAFNMLKKALRDTHKAQSSSAGEAPAIEVTRRLLLLGFAIGVIAGVASGYVGLGGGFLMVPLMLAWLDMPMKSASGTSLIAILLLAIPGAITQGFLGNIDYVIGIATAIGAIPGAFFGARLVSRVPERALRIMFAAFLGLGAILLVVREFVIFG